jgi:hypothetical protein
MSGKVIEMFPPFDREVVSPEFAVYFLGDVALLRVAPDQLVITNVLLGWLVHRTIEPEYVGIADEALRKLHCPVERRDELVAVLSSARIATWASTW